MSCSLSWHALDMDCHCSTGILSDPFSAFQTQLATYLLLPESTTPSAVCQHTRVGHVL